MSDAWYPLEIEWQASSWAGAINGLLRQDRNHVSEQSGLEDEECPFFIHAQPVLSGSGLASSLLAGG